MPLIAGKQIKANTITASQVDVTNGAISTVNAGDAASEGAGTGLSRRDHQHAVETGTPGTATFAAAAAEGTATSLARSDHTHLITLPSAPADVTKAAAAAGTSANLARQDHKHDISTAAAVGIVATDAEGDATSLARSNHTHKLQEVQESLTTEAISGDTALTDKLTAAPRTGSVVKAFLNGVQQEYGAGKDFTVSTDTLTWLAASGTAVDMEVTDVLVVVYST